jgi:hypothetical protein
MAENCVNEELYYLHLMSDFMTPNQIWEDEICSALLHIGGKRNFTQGFGGETSKCDIREGPL